MSITEQLIPYSQKVPRAEVTSISKNGFGADVNNFEGIYGAPIGDALTALCTTAYCREGWIKNTDIEYHNIVRNIAKILNGSDTVIIGHGPLGERAGNLPSIGLDNRYPGWLNTAGNDNEITILSTSPIQVLEKAIRTGTKEFAEYDATTRGSTWHTEIKNSRWKKANWNAINSPLKINRFIQTTYTYWRKTELPAFDLHYISSSDPIKEFLTIYGNRYSNIFGQRFLACFINPDGSLEQKIWQPVKPERAPREHFIKLVDKTILNMPWLIPETVKMAIDTIRYSSVTKLEASIDKLLIEEIRESLITQSSLVKREKGQEWLEGKARKKLETAYYRASLFDEKNGKNKINKELSGVGWFDAVGIRP